MDELIVISEPLKCHFCKMKVNDVIKFGPLYKLGKVRAHYFCVLLSNGLIQNGSDEEGMLGFLLKDIREELHKTKTMMCTYCGKKNASILCSAKKCPKKFHLPCGLENGSLHQFMNEFKSFCRNHRPVQNIPPKILKDALQNGTICCICYERVEVTRKAEDVLWAPCCQKTWYHRHCVQKLAHNAGYFFKCAACNDTSKFKPRMERFGIYVPQQDASWERVPNAFAELLHRHDTCDAEVCKCPDGRRKDEENTIFEIILCRSCGAQGMHVLCGGLPLNDPQWECNVCQAVVTKRRDGKLSPEAAREMKECLFKKAGKSSSELVPPPVKEDIPESLKAETTSTDEIDVDDSGKGESRESGEVAKEREKGASEESVIIIEEEREEEEEEVESRELMEEQVFVEEREKGAAEESAVKILEEEEQPREVIEEQEKGEAEEIVGNELTGEQKCVEEQKQGEQEKEVEDEMREEQERKEAEESVLVIEEEEILEKEESSEPTEEQEDAEKGEKNAEQEKGKAEESVVIIEEDESDKEGGSEELIEEQENEEKEELEEVMEEHEKREEDEIMEELEKGEEGKTLQEQGREEEEKWEEASLECPRKDTFMTMKSPVGRHRKRRRSFEELENSAAGKRRKAGTICGEEQDWTEEDEEGEEDELVVDAEPLSGKWRDVASQTEKTEENFDREEREPKKRKSGDLLEEKTEEDGVEDESGEPKTSKALDLREVMKAMKPGPLSHKISILRKALQRSSSPRHRREGLALFPHFKDIKPGPLCYKVDMFKRLLDGKELPPARHGEDRGKKPLRYRDINPGPRSYKRSVVRKAKGKITSAELKKHLVPRKSVKSPPPVPKMSIIGMEPSTSTSSDYRQGHLGMTSVVADLEDLSRGNLDRLREEQEVEVEEWDGSGEGRRRRTRRVAGGMTGGEERLKNDVSTQTNLRVRIWMMPSRCLPLWNYLQVQQKKGGGGGGGPS